MADVKVPRHLVSADALTEQEAARRALSQRDQTGPLQGGGGGGTFDGMEPRVARLEADMEHVKKTLDRFDGRAERQGGDISVLKADVATLKENVRHLPTKPWLFTTLVMLLSALAAIIGVLIRFLPQAG
jgi:hypothetical protein